jgi:hypothetical protein
MSNIRHVQIPNQVIRNPNVSSLEFMIITKFKELEYENSSSEFFIHSKSHLKDVFRLNDNRTIKKSLNNIYEEGYLSKPVTIDSHSIGKVILNNELLKVKSNFTQVYMSIMKYYDSIGANGVRLLFYYESYINRKITNNQFCYASIKTISAETGLNSKTIIKYNEILKKQKLLHIDKHKLGTEYRYDENDKVIFSKFNNHYSVRLESIL